jgi:sugar phosphate isomerase/epimerase
MLSRHDLLLKETDSSLVQMEMDLYWITKAGADPLRYFREHPGRFPLVHVKDMDATPRKYFTEVGKGVVDFRRVFAQASLGGIRHYFVEQDETAGPAIESARESYQYLKTLDF